jgi:hypothetical protein
VNYAILFIVVAIVVIPVGIYSAIKANERIKALPEPMRPLAWAALRIGVKVTADSLVYRGNTIPLDGATVEMLDKTGQRVTLTRVALLGLFALAAKKKTGTATLAISGADGSLALVRVKDAEQAWAFAQQVAAYQRL